MTSSAAKPLSPKLVSREPELDVALVKIESKGLELDHYFDVSVAARRPVAEPGTGVLAFSNQFQIATRDEPMSVQRGVVAAYSKLYGRIGVFQHMYRGDVYVIDAITNNPGAGGGLITTRKGEPIGLIGKELRNELTNTWINYAIPIGAKAKVRLADDDKEVEVTALDLLELKHRDVLAIPSFEKLAEIAFIEQQHTVDMFDTSQISNPYADEARRQFVSALQQLQGGIEAHRSGEPDG